jgi:hypothetical protein
MAQFARPTADSFRSGWETLSASTLSLFQQVDESAADDDDGVRTPLAPSSAHTLVIKLGALEDPVSSSGHVLRWRYAKDAADGATVDLAVQLRESWRSTTSLGTLISHNSLSDLSHIVTEGTISLSGAEADSITSYGDLYVMFIPTQSA